MGNVRIKWHYDGFNQLRLDPALVDDMRDRAFAIAERAAQASGLTAGFDEDADFIVAESPRKTRARFVVIAASREAQAAEARDGVLTKALRG